MLQKNIEIQCQNCCFVLYLYKILDLVDFRDNIAVDTFATIQVLSCFFEVRNLINQARNEILKNPFEKNFRSPGL